MTKEQKICECRHCGNKGLQTVLLEDTYEILDEEEDYITDIPTWVLKCPICRELSILQYFNPSFAHGDCEEIKYPELIISEKGVPPKIYTAFCSLGAP